MIIKLRNKYSKNKICKILKTSRSSIYWKNKVMHMGRYIKKDDQSILKEIKIIINKRPSYGYKRVTAMINKKRISLGLKIINKKRIYRVMSMNSLLLPKSLSNRNKGHIPTGKVMTLKSNTRWCSDGFEIKYFNGEKVYVAFSLDCCDREIISIIAKKTSLIAEDIQSLMFDSVDKRFNKNKVPRTIQWLSDRGSIYRSKDTVEVGKILNLQSCFTASYSPQSNGMVESFVKTIKRDYVYNSDCETADLVLKMLCKWIKDYNENAPHSALGMLSPMEYKKTNSGV